MLGGEGMGESNFRRGTYTVVLCANRGREQGKSWGSDEDIQIISISVGVSAVLKQGGYSGWERNRAIMYSILQLQ
jgi:hypothetical protein